MAVMRMGHSKSIANNTGTASGSGMNPIFHDFLGMSYASDSPVVFAPKTVGHGGDARRSEASPSASASAGASSGGGRGPISTTSDLGSERQAGDHFDGVPFYGPKSDISGPEISNRLAGSKRSNSDSFMGSSRDGIPQIGPESLESSHLMKLLRNGTGGDRPRRSSDEELFLGMQSLRPTSASLILQPPTGSRTDVNLSKWDRSVTMNVNPTMQYPLRAGQFAPFLHQVPPNRFKDANSGNAGPSNLSQPAADEGSRTGIKGSGILSSITANASGSVSERNPSGLLPSGNRPKSRTHISEPESSTAPSRLGSASSSRQMTIFYGGQAHVFDDVHPNKGIVNDQFCQIQALKNEEQPDAVVRLIDTYILDVEMILSNLKSYIDLPDVDLSKLVVEICKIEEKSSQIGAEHVKIACANLIKACDQKHKDNFYQYLAWMMNEFTKTRSKLEAFAQMERKIIRVRSKAQN